MLLGHSFVERFLDLVVVILTAADKNSTQAAFAVGRVIRVNTRIGHARLISVLKIMIGPKMLTAISPYFARAWIARSLRWRSSD